MSARTLVFVAVGAIGFTVQIAVLTVLTVGSTRAGPATAIAVETAVLVNFWWHERWTWRERAVHGGPPVGCFASTSPMASHRSLATSRHDRRAALGHERAVANAMAVAMLAVQLRGGRSMGFRAHAIATFALVISRDPGRRGPLLRDAGRVESIYRRRRGGAAGARKRSAAQRAGRATPSPEGQSTNGGARSRLHTTVGDCRRAYQS